MINCFTAIISLHVPLGLANVKKDPPQQHEITQLLIAWSGGDRHALDELYPLVYDELHRLARRYLSKEKKGHTLQTTALINEAYVRLVAQKNTNWANRSHFFAISAQIMRRILIDHARSHAYQKRGGHQQRVSLDETATLETRGAAELVRLDDALTTLAEIDPRRSRVVELRYFGGLNNDEIAEALQISPNTVTRDWNMARAWLHQQLAGSVAG